MIRASTAVLLLSMLATALAAEDDKVPFQVLSLPATLGLPDRHDNYVIRSAQQWDIWANNLTVVADALPSIDFERYTALVASAGFKEHGPVVIVFDSITDTGNVIRVHVTVSTPTTCPPHSESGHYAAIALIPRTDKPIEFDASSRDTTCPFH